MVPIISLGSPIKEALLPSGAGPLYLICKLIRYLSFGETAYLWIFDVIYSKTAVSSITKE
jgi:hypothetical protein